MLAANSATSGATRNNQPMHAGILRGGHMLAGVEVSVMISESHSMSATATRTALESGAQVTDHVIQNPDEITVTFAMTNAGNGAANARDVIESFKKMKKEAQLIELATEHALYKDMVITALSFEHSAPYKGALRGTMNLQSIHKVELRVAGRQPENMEGTSQKTMSAPVDAGRQEPMDTMKNDTAAAKDVSAVISAIRNGGASQKTLNRSAG